MIGKHLAHYEITELLGRGGMGEVYRAQDAKLGRDVALKVLPGVMSEDPDRLARFAREARTVAGLNHPNIVTLHSVDEADGVHFLTMELVEGKTLTDHLAVDGLSVEKILSFAIPIAEAMAEAHAQGVVHRDLKPGNVMVTGEGGRVKVLDFGLAKAVAAFDEDSTDQADTLTVTGTGGVVGTPYYMSPEQARAGEVDHRTDLFSLGVMLYEMASGRKPFEGVSSVEILSAVLRDDPTPLTDLRPGLPNNFVHLIQRCLAKAPADRYGSANDLVNDLKSLDSPSGSMSFAPPPASAPDRPAPGSRKTGRYLAAVALFMVAAVAIWQWGIRGSKSGGDPGSDRPVLAVLSFENLGGEQDSYFAEGITDEIRSRLALIRQLGVISRTSMRAYEDTRKTVREIGNELESDYVLEGTIRWDRSTEPGRVRITPRLIRVSDDTQLWTNNYEEEVTGIFDLQAEIAAKIAEALDVSLELAESEALGTRPTESVEAYQLYLQGMEKLRDTGFSAESFNIGVEKFEQAIGIDPEFALAHARLASMHARIYHFGFDRQPERLSRARSAADEAIRLQPELSEAHLALGYYYYWGVRDYALALSAFDAARKNAPDDSEILLATAYVARRQGDFASAIEQFEKVRRLSPRDPNGAVGLGETLGILRRHAEADQALRRAITLAPQESYPYTELALLQLRWRGDAAAARKVLDAMPTTNSSEVCRVSHLVELFAGRFENALAILQNYSGDAIEAGAFYIPIELYEGITLRLMGEEKRATEAFLKSKAILQTKLDATPDDNRLHGSLGLTLAGLGDAAEAVRHGRRAVELYPLEKDSLEAPVQIINLSMIYAMLGDAVATKEQSDLALSIPTILTDAWLAGDPRWK